MEANEGIKMDGPEPTNKSARNRRKLGAKAPIAEAGKRSLNLRIDEDSYQRLNVHALMRHTTVSALVEGFARDQLREFVVHRRAGIADAS